MKTEIEPKPGARRAIGPLVSPALAAYEGGASTEALPAADALAWSLLGLLLFCAVCFLISAWILKTRWEQVQSNLPEDHPGKDESPAVSPQSGGSPDEDAPAAKPWERDPNWWKK